VCAKSYTYGKSRSWLLLVGGGVVFVAGLLFALAILTRDSRTDRGASLVVYCAAGIKAPVEKITRLYAEEYGVDVRLTHNNSGGLLSSIEVHPEGDLYIPADGLFIERGRKKGLIAESLPLARFRLVVGVKQGNPKQIRTLDDLLRPEIDYALCNEQAGAGKTTMASFEKVGRWKEVQTGAKVFKPTVTDAASAVQTSESVDAGILWNSTAKQYDLEIVNLPELADAVADIHVGLLVASKQPAAALRFARYLAAPERGAPVFAKAAYEPIPGDAWAEIPELVVYAGGVNRGATRKTLREFQEREGCRILAQFGGCGTLIGKLKSSPVRPEMFLTCEASYMTMVQDLFLAPQDVSQTPIVLLVREKNEKGIQGLEDLAKEGVHIGITKPSASALGALSVKVLEEAGIWERVRPNIRVEAPTAHELVLQVEGHDKLDVAMVYEANCQNLKPGLKMIPLDHPDARAVQNVAAGLDTKYPHMVQRLIEALTSSKSRKRFESNGFRWLADRKQP
jgi:ABC-type molybdate transport system substrate-binding protein